MTPCSTSALDATRGGGGRAPRALTEPTKPTTVADASVASGLATRDVEAGLTLADGEYRGHLRVTEEGDLVRLFPDRLHQAVGDARRRSSACSSVPPARSSAPAGFIVRAWLLVVMIGYALIFVALIIGLTLARQGSNDRDGGPASGSSAGSSG